MGEPMMSSFEVVMNLTAMETITLPKNEQYRERIIVLASSWSVSSCSAACATLTVSAGAGAR